MPALDLRKICVILGNERKKYVMTYTIEALKQNLILIVWRQPPQRRQGYQYLRELEERLNAAEAPLYFISDLRKGRIADIRIISQLSRHPNWAGSTAFSRDPMTRMLVGTYQRLTEKEQERNTMYDTPEQAIAFLESLEEGLTAGVDWVAYLGGDHP